MRIVLEARRKRVHHSWVFLLGSRLSSRNIGEVAEYFWDLQSIQDDISALGRMQSTYHRFNEETGMFLEQRVGAGFDEDFEATCILSDLGVDLRESPDDLQGELTRRLI